MPGMTSSGDRKLRIALLALGFGAVVAGISATAAFGYGKVQQLREARLAKDARSSTSAPRRIAMVVAPAPLPTTLPVTEREGNDVYGYPRSYVDGPGLRSLLDHGRHAELNTYIEQLQREFEADPRKELLTVRAIEAFATSAPELLPKLDAWAAATPASFAPYAARGTYWAEVAFRQRGTRWARDTPAEAIKGMHEAATPARRDLQHALTLAPKLVAVMRQLVGLAMPISDDLLRDDALRRAEHACPSCFSVRSKYIVSLEPRWGGSYDAMEAFAARAPVALNPRLKLLRGYVETDRAAVAQREKKLDDALRFANAACALGPHWDFLSTRADVLVDRNDFEHALSDLDAAIELRPELPALRRDRAKIYEKLGAWEPAGRDLIESMRLDASDEWARWLLPRIVRGLSSEGYAAHLRGDRTTAVRLLELASQLSPFDREVQQRREQAVRGNITGTADELARLEATAREAPDDFNAHQQLDFALAKQGKYPRVIEMWTEYLTRHPQDGPAYFERSGAYYNSGHKAEAEADTAKACQLGVNQACAYQGPFR
jgi:tetratricopeptide (TPR) repeat protein